jgi:uncharacterized membrane protein (DUF2068 family)
MQHADDSERGPLKAIGLLKLISGFTALAAGIGLFGYAKQDPAQGAERLIEHFGLDPQNHLIHGLLSKLTGVSPKQLRTLAIGTFFYATLHMIEGTGLIMGLHWAEYLVVFATGSLVPFEVYEIFRKPTPLRFALLLANLAIVAYLIYALRADHKKRLAKSRAPD